MSWEMKGICFEDVGELVVKHEGMIECNCRAFGGCLWGGFEVGLKRHITQRVGGVRLNITAAVEVAKMKYNCHVCLRRGFVITSLVWSGHLPHSVAKSEDVYVHINTLHVCKIKGM